MPNPRTTPRRTRKAQVALHKLGLALMAVAMGLAGVGALRNNVAVAAPTTITVQVGQRPSGTSGSQFNAAAVTINLGDTVSFIRFAGSHDATSVVVPAGGSQFLSPSPMAAGSPPTVTPAAAGIYTYYCTIHADPSEATLANIALGKMVGKITVNAPAAPTATPGVATATPTATTAPGTATPTGATAASCPREMRTGTRCRHRGRTNTSA